MLSLFRTMNQRKTIKSDLLTFLTKALTDDDITNDIACLKTLMNSM